MSRRHAKGRRKPTQLSTGIIRITRKGYGFVDTPEGEYLITRGQLHGAMDGDLVGVQRLRGAEARRDRERKETGARRKAGFGSGSGKNDNRRDMLGAVRRVLERAHETAVGTYERYDGLGIMRPFDERIPDIFIDNRIPTSQHAKSGDVVVIRITTYPSRLEAASGFIEEIIGQNADMDIDTEVIIRRHELETVFSAAALEEAAALEGGDAVDVLAGDSRRRDIRDRFIFTIDPKDAKDFDDAISLDYVEGQLRLGVHIADVSAYVAWDSALDLNARRRATSTYLPDRVIPMLPTQISDELCSLKPHEDKLAFTVDMMMNSDGSVAETTFYPSLIRSSARLTYEEAGEMLANPDRPSHPDDPSCYSPNLQEKLLTFNKLAKKLAARRARRGAIEFESVEAKVKLDESGRPTGVYLRQKTEATAMIEEAMILANEQVAAYVMAAGAPMIYRVHEDPQPLSLEELLPTLKEFGYADETAPQTSKEIQAILDKSAGKPEHHLISSLLLRAMKRAVYAPTFSTHFGLASKGYTHFTSPIRRYPDLMAHRLLKCLLFGEPLPDTIEKQLEGICKHSSDRERESDQASLEALALKLCEYLTPRVGELFWGIITSVNTHGMTVREDSTTAEGFVDVIDLGASYVFEPDHYRYHDPDSGKSLRLGQAVRVKLTGVDRRAFRLRFVIA